MHGNFSVVADPALRERGVRNIRCELDGDPALFRRGWRSPVWW
jgi:hypothetical protein